MTRSSALIFLPMANNCLQQRNLRVANRADRNRERLERLLFDFPSIKQSSGAPAVPGKNQDVTIQAGFQAFMHATLNYTMRVSRFGHLPHHRGVGRSRREPRINSTMPFD